MRRKGVEVTWVDAASDRNGWQPHGAKDAQPSQQVIHTIGYLLEKTDRYVHLAQSISEEMDQTSERITIPAGCVIQIRKL